MNLDIDGRRVVDVTFTFHITLSLENGLLVIVESEATIEHDRWSATMDPEHLSDRDRETFIELRGHQVQSACAHSDGTLDLAVANGTTVRVPPDPDHEAWEVIGPNDSRVVCMPGGQLAVWS